MTGMLVVAIVLVGVYWTIWFTHRDWLASVKTHSYYDFEDAFPLADGLLALTALWALVALRRDRPSALPLLVAVSSMGLYLFAMDLLYDLEHGIFAKGAGGATEAVLVLVELVFAVTVLSWAWSHRGELMSERDVS